MLKSFNIFLHRKLLSVNTDGIYWKSLSMYISQFKKSINPKKSQFIHKTGKHVKPCLKYRRFACQAFIMNLCTAVFDFELILSTIFNQD